MGSPVIQLAAQGKWLLSVSLRIGMARVACISNLQSCLFKIMN